MPTKTVPGVGPQTHSQAANDSKGKNAVVGPRINERAIEVTRTTGRPANAHRNKRARVDRCRWRQRWGRWAGERDRLIGELEHQANSAPPSQTSPSST